MTIEHSAAADPDIHEPKGVAAASADQVYVADGAGSGTWTTVSNLNINGLNAKILTVKMEDISTAKSVWVVSPYAGDITNVYSVINGTISGANCGISLEIGGTAVTGGGITIAFSGSAAGDVDSSTPTALNTVTAGQAIEIISDGASTGAVDATFTIVLDVS